MNPESVSEVAFIERFPVGPFHSGASRQARARRMDYRFIARCKPHAGATE